MDKDLNQERREFEKNLWELEQRQSMRRKFDTILKLYSLLGLLISIFGLAYFVFTTLDIELSKPQQIALLVSGTGIALSITSWALLLMHRERMNENIRKLKTMQDIGEFVWKWSKFEEVGKQILLSEGSEFNRYSIREVIEELYKRNLIDREDTMSLDEAIQARNMVVHGDGVISKEMLAHYSSRIDDITSKIIERTSNKHLSRR
ncbi:hypothetical protein NM74_19100 [Aeromonas hydrophila]|uniref:hypothetical protein n=1 Tax=Aeromonas hydrophila TaxID=644 RepID=UPI00053835B6|nr:hypothetical protein [Aeromonas hydrophila]KHA54978.1 hypothetical protein NM74_19100 [Aeromonas hydrophila]